MDFPRFEAMIQEYRKDSESVYNTWFLNNEDRLKAFRTIKSGLNDVIHEIENRTFGTDFKGSSLEVVVTAVSEQKQVFEGAAHAFFWKPKLRIPDIYENEQNQLAFGRFLKACSQATNERQVIEQILKLDQAQIKGLGPAVANILYFLHPTIFPPFNTAIINGFNALFGQKMKLGSWTCYLEMREQILNANGQLKHLLSKDLGAFTGLLFEIGIGRLVIEENASTYLQKEKEKRDKTVSKRHKEIQSDMNEESEHSEMQFHLARLGNALGYQIWIAQNDHKRQWNGTALNEFTISSFPQLDIPVSVRDTASLIDVIWFDDNYNVVSAFEVEKSTSIYSGILRLHDLSLSLEHSDCHLFLVAPDKREKEIKAQLLRPSFQKTALPLSYILFSDLRCDCDAMCKYGSNATVLSKISKAV